jgi:hypothetical protein
MAWSGKRHCRRLSAPLFAATRRQFPSDRGLASELQNHRPDLRHDSGVSRSESYGCERRAAR